MVTYGETTMAKEQSPAPRRVAEQMARSSLMRDVIVFQGKLLLDAFKDVLLGPASLIVALVDLLRPGPRSELLFYRVLAYGKTAERTIDLFSAVGQLPQKDSQWTVDEMIDQVETNLSRKTPGSRGPESDGGGEGEEPGMTKPNGEKE